MVFSTVLCLKTHENICYPAVSFCTECLSKEEKGKKPQKTVTSQKATALMLIHVTTNTAMLLFSAY